MNYPVAFGVFVLVSALIGYACGRARALRMADMRIRNLHSLPGYYGFFVVLWVVIPVVILALIWQLLSSFFLDAHIFSIFSAELADMAPTQAEAFLRDVRIFDSGVRLSGTSAIVDEAVRIRKHDLFIDLVLFWSAEILLSLCCFCFALSRISPDLRARNRVEQFIRWILILSSAIAIFTTIGIVLSLIVESWRFFYSVPLHDFLFGFHWNPELAMSSGHGESGYGDVSGSFGAVPLFVGTALITLITMCVATPIGLLAAIYLSDYASAGFRLWAKPVLEILAGIPTVVYGFFAALTVAPLVRDIGMMIGLDVASESALAAGLVMGIMIIPFVSSLSDDVICAVPRSLRDGSAALGATKSETVLKVVLPAALPGIVSALLLAVSRAVGETMIVVMAAGLAANLTINPLEAVTTVTVQVVTLLVGDQEFDSPATLAAFALGLVLFFVTLALNVIALRVVSRYRERYD